MSENKNVMLHGFGRFVETGIPKEVTPNKKASLKRQIVYLQKLLRIQTKHSEDTVAIMERRLEEQQKSADARERRYSRLKGVLIEFTLDKKVGKKAREVLEELYPWDFE